MPAQDVKGDAVFSEVDTAVALKHFFEVAAGAVWEHVAQSGEADAWTEEIEERDEEFAIGGIAGVGGAAARNGAEFVELPESAPGSERGDF